MNISEKVYDELRRDILEARIPPGEKLSEVQLANRFGVSRAPVRDAITRLQQDHLVQVKPQIGTIVSPISEETISNVLEVRILLEPHAAEKAAANFTDEDREILSYHFDRLSKLDPDSEARKRKLYETDALLHNLIWDRCGNPEIKFILDRYRGEIQRIRLSNAELGNRLAPSEQEIRAIFEALDRGDGAETARALGLHLENIRKALKTIFAALSAGVSVKSQKETDNRIPSVDRLRQQ
jgi:GntR family transcriptional regulator, rspAB operon transcriptional repressor